MLSGEGEGSYFLSQVGKKHLLLLTHCSNASSKLGKTVNERGSYVVLV